MKILSKILIVFVVLFCLFLTGYAIDDVEPSTLVYEEETYPILIPSEDENCITVCWYTSDDEPMEVYYAVQKEETEMPQKADCQKTEAISKQTSNTPVGYYQNTATLSVEPGRVYEYGVAEKDGFPTAFYTFSTGNDDQSTAIFISDLHVQNSQQVQKLDSVMDQAIQNVKEAYQDDSPEVVLCMGDMLDKYSNNPNVFAPDATFMRNIVFANAIGNHDLWTSLSGYFPEPNQNEYLDYCFVKNEVLYISLFPNFMDNLDENINDLRTFVQEHEGEYNWSVLFTHFPLQSDGSHGKDPDVYFIRKALMPVISELDIDLVIGGHDHEYNRSAMISEWGGARTSVCTDVIYKLVGETMYLTNPTTTGIKFYSLETRIKKPQVYAPVVSALEKEAGYITAEFTEEQITVKTFGVQSGLVDSFVIKRFPYQYISTQQLESTGTE